MKKQVFDNRWRLHEIDTKRIKREIRSCVIDARQPRKAFREPTTFLSHEQIGEISAKLDEVEKIYNDLFHEYRRLFGQREK